MSVFENIVRFPARSLRGETTSASEIKKGSRVGLPWAATTTEAAAEGAEAWWETGMCLKNPRVAATPRGKPFQCTCRTYSSSKKLLGVYIYLKYAGSRLCMYIRGYRRGVKLKTRMLK